MSTSSSATTAFSRSSPSARWYVSTLGFAPVVDKAFGAGQRFVLVAPPGQKDFGIILEQARRDDPTMPVEDLYDNSIVLVGPLAKQP